MRILKDVIRCEKYQFHRTQKYKTIKVILSVITDLQKHIPKQGNSNIGQMHHFLQR